MDGAERTSLHELFEELVTRVFAQQLRLHDRELLVYLAELLARFAHRDRLYALRDALGRPLEEVAAMLAEGDLLLNAASFSRERQVHKHVGDYTLFVTGLWPEWHARLQRRGADALLDLEATGRRSYYLASTFDHEPYDREAPVLRRLSDEWERCRLGLGLVRGEMERLGATPP